MFDHLSMTDKFILAFPAFDHQPHALHKQLQLYYVVLVVILRLVADSSHCYNFLTSKEGYCQESNDI